MSEIRHVKIPVVKEVGLELILRLETGEEVAVNKKDLYPWRLSGKMITFNFRFVRDLQKGYSALCYLIRRGSNGLIPVELAGKGPTEKSKKVRVSGVIYTYWDDSGSSAEERKKHTVTIPASQIVERDDQACYAPRWVLKKAIHRNVLGGKSWPKAIEGGVWLGAVACWEAVFSPFEKKISAELEEEERRQTARAQIQKEEAVRREARQQVEAEARVVAEEERRQGIARKKAQKDERMASLENIRVARAEWDEWVSFKNKYGSKSHKKVTRSVENCTLFFSGQRVYIKTESGEEIIKTRETVRWGDANPTKELAADA